MISCRQIIELPSLKKLKIAGGRDGLDRTVRWVHFIDLPDVLPWVRGGELLFITGIGLKNDETQLVNLVHGIANKQLAGLVINVGPYIPSIPQSVIQLADVLKFPVFELPWEVKLVEVTQDVSRYIVTKQIEEKSIHDLLENILFVADSDFSSLIRRGTYHGYDLSLPCQVGIVRTDDFETCLTEPQDEVTLMKLKERFERIVRNVLDKSQLKALTMARADSIIFLLSGKAGRQGSRSETTALAQEIINNCSLKMPKITVKVGFGECSPDLAGARDSFDQARMALKLAGFAGDNGGICHYGSLGINKLLFELDQRTLEAYYQETLGELLKYDEENGTELMYTLAAYFRENGNAMQAAKRTFIHKNTLAYRLKKIEQITGKSLTNMYDRIALQMGLIIGKQLD